MRNVLIWLKRHMIAIGCMMIALSGIAFAIIYKVNQNQPPGTITAGKSGVSIVLQSAPIGVWVVLAIALGAGGICIAGYSILRHRDDKDALDKQFKKMVRK